MTVTYRPASEPARIAAKLIDEHHTHLAGFRIDYVFRSEAAKSGGKTVLGKARKMSGLNAFLATEPDERPADEEDISFFVIELAEDTWSKLSAAQRVALVDHQLCHCVIEWKDDGELVLKIKGHDLEEFRCIVERHGLWDSDVAQFADTIAQAVKARYGTPTIPDDDTDGHELARLVGLDLADESMSMSISSEGPSPIVDAIAGAAAAAGGTVTNSAHGTRTVTLDADQLARVRDHIGGHTS